MEKHRKGSVIGIVGGMGPQAGVALFNSILHHTRATTDQDHFSVILMSFPGDIPDRTAFLEGYTHENPAYPIADSIRRLENAGATTVGIACNTSYCPAIYRVILEELDRTDTRIRLLNLPEETCAYIRENYSYIRRIGAMTTNGTYRSGIYRDSLRRFGYDVIVPGPRFQDEVIHRMIYDPVFGLKATPKGISFQARVLAHKAFDFFKHKGAELVILGCTDLTVLSDDSIVKSIPIVDSTEVLALALIKNATTGLLNNELKK